MAMALMRQETRDIHAKVVPKIVRNVQIVMEEKVERKSCNAAEFEAIKPLPSNGR